MVDVFETALHEAIDHAVRQLTSAQRAEQSFLAHRHAARLLDLLEQARRHGIDTSGWVEPSALAAASDSV